MARLTEKLKQELRTGAFENNNYLLNAEDVAEMLSVSIPYVYKLAYRGKIKSIRWPTYTADGEISLSRKTIRFQQKDILDFIKEWKL